MYNEGGFGGISSGGPAQNQPGYLRGISFDEQIPEAGQKGGRASVSEQSRQHPEPEDFEEEDE